MGAYTCWLAGVEYRPRSARALLGRAKCPCLLDARREPDNPHDANAVGLWLSGEMVGYLPARQAEWVAERIDRGNFTEIYLVDVAGSDAELLVVTSIFDAPEGTASAAEADRLAEEQAAAALVRAADAAMAEPVTDAVAVLLWLASAGSTPADLADAVIDDFIGGELAANGATPTRERTERLRKGAKGLKGSRQRALKAIAALKPDRQRIARLLPHCLAMAKADGTLKGAEADALREIIALLRAE